MCILAIPQKDKAACSKMLKVVEINTKWRIGQKKYGGKEGEKTIWKPQVAGFFFFNFYSIWPICLIPVLW